MDITKITKAVELINKLPELDQAARDLAWVHILEFIFEFNGAIRPLDKSLEKKSI